jgi:hypothetical protein
MQTRIDASGVAKRSLGLAWLNELSEMLVSLCDNWPVEEVAAIAVDEGPPAPGTADEPRILTAHWGAPLPEQSQRDASRSDAA